MQDERVTAVVVTWNRRELLAEALSAIQQQTVPPSRVIVVDNASDDGTGQLLASRFPHVDVVTACTNMGGAGGFALGLAAALGTSDVGRASEQAKATEQAKVTEQAEATEQAKVTEQAEATEQAKATDRAEESPAANRCNAVWLMDDDTIPEPTALAELVKSRHSHPDGPPALVASRVVWTDGRDHPMNTPRIKPGVRAAEIAAAARAGGVPIRSASFVSVLVDAEAARRRGPPIADYFVWNDDFEFTTRLIRGQHAVYCPASVVIHKTKTFGSTDADPGERFYYEVRNKVWLFTRSRGLNPLEKTVYAASTLRRWSRTMAHSSNRSVLVHGLGSGLLDGVRKGPRPTSELIAKAVSAAEPARSAVAMPEQFSLLMSVWSGDDAGFLEAAFRSVVHDQTRPPDDVVLVQDGPVPHELSDCITGLIHESPVPTTLLALDANVGLGTALDQGMTACAHDIVARMDADDIALPQRFAVQVPLVEQGADLVGSSLLEFGVDAGDIVGKRVPPLDPDEIVRYARFHQPFNHPTVVYRRSVVQAAGGIATLL
ncbi:MAG: glycosyltransferase [Nocardioidaceae bacterium]